MLLISGHSEFETGLLNIKLSRREINLASYQQTGHASIFADFILVSSSKYDHCISFWRRSNIFLISSRRIKNTIYNVTNLLVVLATEYVAGMSVFCGVRWSLYLMKGSVHKRFPSELVC